jgi:hypothetical protein
MFRKGLSIGTIVVILVVALAAIGVGYGLWSETLKIEGTVHTGEVDVGFSGPYIDEWVYVTGQGYILEPDEKDVTTCQAALFGSQDPQDNGASRIVVTVTGAYPYYLCRLGFDVTNLGTVPVHVHQPVQAAGDNTASAYVDGCYAQDTQVHPGGSTGVCYLYIWFPNTPAIEENETYTFAFDVFAHQWNEEP